MTDSSPNGALLTIGHSNHDIARFIDLLRQHAVAIVADVRSAPYSRYTPQFNKDPLAAALDRAGIQYAFLGRELGARRSERECYVNGVARYDHIVRVLAFREGIDRVHLYAASNRVALMCAEKDPLTCHRTILVARNLRLLGLSADHILEDGSIETTAQAEERLLRMFFPDGGDLFHSRTELIEAAYDQQSEQIQFTESAADESANVMR